MWDPPGPGLEPVSPASAGRFLTTAPPGKSLFFSFWGRKLTSVYSSCLLWAWLDVGWGFIPAGACNSHHSHVRAVEWPTGQVRGLPCPGLLLEALGGPGRGSLCAEMAFCCGGIGDITFPLTLLFGRPLKELLRPLPEVQVPFSPAAGGFCSRDVILCLTF